LPADEACVTDLLHRLDVYSQRMRLTAMLTILATIPLMISAGPARAVVTTVGPAEVGLQQRSSILPEWFAGHGPDPEEFANPAGNPVLPANKTYAIYWDPTDHYHGDWQHLIDVFLQSVGAESGSGNVFAVDAQYTDAANEHALYRSAFVGAYIDTDRYPESSCEDPHPFDVPDRIGPEAGGVHTSICLDDQQVRAELQQFIGQHGLQKGMGPIFYVMTPPGVTVCLSGGGVTGHCSDYAATAESYENSFCSYHSAISPTSPTTGDANTILYSVIPWSAGGYGDGQLTAKDKSTPSFDCQDGGYDPSSKPAPEKHEEKKETKKNQKKEEEEPLTAEEEKELKEKELLEGPHQQEPNQGTCPSNDGYCDAGLADLIINQIAVEQQNIVTNPLLNAWQVAGNEATDECRNYFASAGIQGGVTANLESKAGTLFNQVIASHDYYLNDAFNLAAFKLSYPGIACLPGIRLEPEFTAPNPSNANEPIDFDGMESDISLNVGTTFTGGVAHNSYATYTWNFGDGSPSVSGSAPGAPAANSPETAPCAPPWEAPCAASVFHSYQYGGTYEVTLTVTDAGQNVASVTHPVTVSGPPPPSSSVPGPPAPPSGAPAVGAPGGSATIGGGSSKAQVVTTAPVVSGLVESKSLKKVLKTGLAVRYSVNEQVAGSIQVMLDAVTAKRLGLRGVTATGLPKGSPRSIVVGTALLVTTKAGKGTIHVKFSPRNGARLALVRKLKLTLRLFARNASRQSPRTTTVLSTVVLGR
jgi:hypothetical protein